MRVISEETRIKLVDALSQLPYLEVAALIKELTTEAVQQDTTTVKESKTRSK